ncbi:CpaF family protein [Paraconexibacter sp.]|uniref:CpaF family protein n=1 Tax=Paraconexibacter sp. TaxID=2949640 RepID=UPI003568E60D
MELHERLRLESAPAGGGTVDVFAELKNRIHLAVIQDLGPQLFAQDLAVDDLRRRVVAGVRSRLEPETGLAREDRDRLVEEIADDTVGYGPLERLLADPGVSEIMVNGPHSVWIESAGRLSKTPVRFHDDSHLRRIINKIVAQVGRRIDEASPMVDARLQDGSRINAIIPPLSLTGPVLTIRKFTKNRMMLSEFEAIGTLSAEAIAFLDASVQAGLNIVVVGGTGTGKTTLLNAMSACIPEDERIVTIEDAAELKLQQEHVLRLESRPRNVEGEGEVSIRDLVKNALRMRPDRIVVGECRGAETLDMLQAMNTGHDGSLTTVHANTPRDALARLETLVLMAGFDLPITAIRQQIASALDLVVQLERMRDGTRKVTYITEVQRMESGIITLQDLFRYEMARVDHEGNVVGTLKPTGLRPAFAHKFERAGVTLAAAFGQVGGYPRAAG